MTKSSPSPNSTFTYAISRLRTFWTRVGLLAIGLFVVLSLGCLSATSAVAVIYPSHVVEVHAEFMQELPAPSGGGNVVCIIDSGVSEMQSLHGKISGRISIDGGDPSDMEPVTGHGSLVASAIAGNPQWGAAGIWPAAKIFSIRAGDAHGIKSGWVDYLQSCPTSGGARVVNLSFGIDSPFQYMIQNRVAQILGIKNYYDLNLVGATGNSGGAVSFPAQFAFVTGVGATCGGSGLLCNFSNRGIGMNITAPGSGIEVSGFHGQILNIDGTSFSAPLVSGVIAAIRAYRPDLSGDMVERIVVNSGTPTMNGPTLNAENAFKNAGLGYLVKQYSPKGKATSQQQLGSGKGNASRPPHFQRIHTTVREPKWVPSPNEYSVGGTSKGVGTHSGGGAHNHGAGAHKTPFSAGGVIQPIGKSTPKKAVKSKKGLKSKILLMSNSANRVSSSNGKRSTKKTAKTSTRQILKAVLHRRSRLLTITGLNKFGTKQVRIVYQVRHKGKTARVSRMVQMRKGRWVVSIKISSYLVRKSTRGMRIILKDNGRKDVVIQSIRRAA